MAALYKNDGERWEFRDGERHRELSSGSAVDVFAFGQWLRGRIESDEAGYYFLHESGDILRDLQGREARLGKAEPTAPNTQQQVGGK